MLRGEVWWVNFDPSVDGEIRNQRSAIILSNDAANKYLNRVQVVPLTSVATNPAWRPSLLQDLDAGRRLELDAWSGGAVKMGQELGIATPANFAIYAGLKPYEHGRA